MTSSFNPAQIPLNLGEQEVSDKQIPIDDVAEHVDELLAQDAKVTTLDVPSAAYEHQNIAETIEDRAIEAEPILPSSSVDPMHSTIDDPFAADESYTQTVTEDPFENMDTVEDPFAQLVEDEQKFLTDSAVEGSTSLLENPPTEPQNDAPDLFSTAVAPASSSNKDLPELLDIPDELDEADFNIDDELEAEFAEMEASFQQSMIIERPPDPPTSNSAIRSARVTSNPYLPSRDLPTQQTVPSNAPSSSQSLFTPAQMLTGAPRAVSATYAPRVTSPSLFSTKPTNIAQAPKSSTPSFVSGKVAYEDPYALPETLVPQRRLRPQAQSLRSIASVPNLKTQPAPPFQRQVSSHALPQPGPPPNTAQSSMNRTKSPNNVYNGTNRMAPAMSPDITAPQHNQHISSSNYAPQRSYTPHNPVSGSSSTYSPSNDPVRQSSAYNPASQTARMSPPAKPRPVQSVNRNQDALYAPPPTQRYLPERHTGLNNAMHHSRQQLSIDSLLSNGQQHSVNEELNQPPVGHSRHISSGGYSAMSDESEGHQHEAFGQFIADQRGAEEVMFKESYAVAEDDIQEAQAIQRAPSVTSSHRSMAPMQLQSASQPRPIPGHVPTSFSVPSSPPRSPDSRVDEHDFRRPSSRSSTQHKYASTEPNTSPRVQQSGFDNAMRPTSSGSRPSQLSRATSSFHAYQPFIRSGSPIASVSRQNSFVGNQTSAPHKDHPIARFGFGGKLLTMVPKTIPRFSAQGTLLTETAGPGMINIKNIRDILPDSVLADFPGPLLHGRSPAKQKRTDAMAWLTRLIDTHKPNNESDLMLLYQLLSLILEFNGSLDSTTAKSKVAQLLCPELTSSVAVDEMAHFKVAANMVSANDTEHDLSGDIISTSTLTESKLSKLSDMLLRGDKDSALRFACENKLWSHALMISTRVSAASWTSVVHEFVESEMTSSSPAAQSVRDLYVSFALASTSGKEPSGVSQDQSNHFINAATNWRRSLATIINNRAAMDDPAICQLGRSLLARGKLFASHFCFLVCNKAMIGAVDDPSALFSLIGVGDIRVDGTGIDINEAVAVTEIYEFALSLAAPKYLGMPHLLGFKLRRAQALADSGHLANSKKYCDGMTMALKTIPKGPNSLHHVLIEQLRDLTLRIDQNPGDEGSTWLGTKIARPKIDNIWGSLEGKFNKFVAGDADKEVVNTENSTQGPFGRLAQNPAVSRVQSFADLRHTQLQQDAPYANHAPNRAQQASPVGSFHAAAPSYLRPAPSRSSSFAQYQGNQVVPVDPSGYTQPQSLEPSVPSTGAYAQSYLPDNASYQMPQATNQYAPVMVPDTQSNSYAAPESNPQSYVPSPVIEQTEAVEPAPEKEEKQKKQEKPKASEAGDEKKAGWLGGWFGGKKKETANADVKVHKAKLGEGMSLVYDPVTKKWVNPKGDMPEDKTASAPPPPMSKKPAPSPMQAPSQFPAASRDASPAPSPQIGTLSDGPKPAARPPTIMPRKIASADEDLAAMLGSGPVPRRAASGSAPPGSASAAGSVRAKKGKPAKRYVDILQDGA